MRKSFAPNSTPFSKTHTYQYIGRECRVNPSSLHLPPISLPHDWFGATAAKLEGLGKKTFCPNICLKFFKTVLTSTQPASHFSKKIHRIFPSINHRQSLNSQPTHSPCLCLAGWLPASKPAGHVWPRLSCKENKQIH